jgi:dimethylargininase
MALITNRVIVSTPGKEYFSVSELDKHNITSLSDPEKSLIQHLALTELLIDSGFEVLDVLELKDHPNSVFTRDSSLVTPKGYIKLKMGLESRKGEEEWMAKKLDSLGIKKAGNITGNGTVEGGDVIIHGSIAFVGLSKRTNKEGVNQVSKILNTMNFEVRSVEVPGPFLHLGGAMSILSSNDVLCCQGIFPMDFFNGFNRIEVARDSFVSGNVISLGNYEVMAEKTNISAIEILEHYGYKVHSTDLSEFIKGTGGPSCLILPC